MTEQISIEKVKPKVVGQKCPVCAGFGSVNWGKQTCHACQGRGYILIPLEEIRDREQNGQ